ncbi:helix-turn-helix transcriptional regulator [bacterium]|nr:helix-turn-helix transcriptional regulator [bacterium]
MEIKKRLGKRIQELRLKNNLKQSELAEKVGLATKSQSCIETGKTYPSAEVIEKYAKVFNVDISEVLDISHEKPVKEVLDDMIDMLKKACDEDIIRAYRILKGLLN